MTNPFDFTHKKIVITGATSGIGLTTAIMLAKQGAIIHAVGRREEALIDVMNRLDGDCHRYHIEDLCGDVNYRKLFDEIVSDGKKIDGMVYCAGIAKVLPVNIVNYKNMDETMRVNFYSFIEMVSALSKKRYHENTSIVAVSSIAAEYPGKCQGIYAASKAAMNTMVQSLALELTEKDIRINTVMPASTNTRMLNEANENRGQKEVEREIHKQLLGLEEPEDISNVIMFLLSDASRVITGRAIYADAGYIDF
ncbi:MAG: SDR family oxidoreductase [Lachnospiraceae bacterium]|jgi:NAD(P)-dependent dehydrogenase (short-subunit alcohol dehydrogenase family)|nr:SDR family oxidoreductase [Lachnospiraceae bacterium]